MFYPNKKDETSFIYSFLFCIFIFLIKTHTYKDESIWIRQKTSFTFSFILFKLGFNWLIYVCFIIFKMLLRLALITTFIGLCISASTSPTWTVTTSVKTGTATLFSSLFPAGSTQSFSVTYSSGFFTGGQIPYFVYGIRRYKGNHIIYVANDFILQ